MILISLQLVLMICAVILSFAKKTKKLSNVRTLYVLILIFWLFNLFTIGHRRLLPFEVKVIFQLISIIVFLIIHHKVSKWTK